MSQPADVKAAAQKWAEVWCARGGQTLMRSAARARFELRGQVGEGSQHRAAVGGSMMQSFAPSREPDGPALGDGCISRRRHA